MINKGRREQAKFWWVAMVPGATLLAYSCAAPTDVATNNNSVTGAVVANNQPASGTTITPAISGNMPYSVPGASTAPTPEAARPFFDAFSWESFIALTWPVDPKLRGVPLNPNDPNTFFNMTNTTPSVWASYRNQWDLFAQGTNRPAPWQSNANPINPNNASTRVNHVFGLSKTTTLHGDFNEAFSVPLVDQQLNYALYEMRYNELQYNFVRGQDADPTSWLYLKKNLVALEQSKNGVQAPPSDPSAKTAGGLLVKAAWKVLTAKDDASRYYVIDEQYFDPVTNKYVTAKLGLVGLHIVQKVNAFPEWVWSSFEQVDNVPGASNAKQPYSFNNGTDKPATDRGYANKPPNTNPVPVSQRVAVQVTRYNPIPTTPKGMSTVDINALFQKAVGKTWLQYYQLVITQWPSDPSTFTQFNAGGKYPAQCGGAFPQNGCANSTMETYYQSSMDAATFGNSCMSCHYQASAADFSWSLYNRSH